MGVALVSSSRLRVVEPSRGPFWQGRRPWLSASGPRAYRRRRLTRFYRRQAVPSCRVKSVAILTGNWSAIENISLSLSTRSKLLYFRDLGWSTAGLFDLLDLFFRPARHESPPDRRSDGPAHEEGGDPDTDWVCVHEVS
jgi:hypothetical protein